MCGILGQINFRNINADRFRRALDLQYHRGPDDYGVFQDDNFIFGHRRLSIIDLTSQAKQPMISNCGNYVLVFNGEIYNYQELKSDLINRGHIFRTESDTEVLLNSYIEYGINAIQKFIGMFAFALYDKTRQETYIVRDRLGVKPLFYQKRENKIVFSSEIKSILALLDDKRSLNKSAISSYLSFRYPILGDTFFENINSLPPAHYIKITKNSVDLVEYWNVAHKFSEQKNDRGEEYYISEIRKILESSVKYRMISDVPIGSFLSGGVDSSLITALMAKSSDNAVKSFTIGFAEDGFNEFEYADVVAKKYRTDHRQIVLSGADYISAMQELITYKDAPLSVPNEVALYLMSRELKKYITVVLSGEGADEIFGGYGRIFRSPYDFERMQNFDALGFSVKEKDQVMRNFIEKYGQKSFSSAIQHFMSIYSYTSFDDKKALLHESIDLESIEQKLREKFLLYFDELAGESYYNKLMYTFEKVHIVGLLHRADTATMATSVEARVPFVDHRLVELAFTIPLKYKLRWNSEVSKKKSRVLMSDKISENYDIPKYILKQAYVGELPSKVLFRKKVGFPVPLNNWFGGSFNSYAKDILLSEKARQREIYNTDNISTWLARDSIAEKHGDAMKIWMLVNLELFLNEYFDKEA